MSSFADIVFPTAVRTAFTYDVPEDKRGEIRPGMRVWVPLQQHTSIGMVVDCHDREPDFQTRPIERILDEEPILSGELLELTEWIHRFYYCGWGEVIQAALPVGLNFYAEKFLRPGDNADTPHLSDLQQEIVDAIRQNDRYLLSEARRRWSEDRDTNVLDKLIRNKVLEVWEEPRVKVEPKREKAWDWAEDINSDTALEYFESLGEKEQEYKWARALQMLTELELPQLQKDLVDDHLLTYYSLNRIAKEGVIESREVEARSFELNLEYDPGSLNTLTDEQQEAYQSIEKEIEQERFASFLLYGITGSGKTEVYIHALKKVLEQGRGGLILVPEIGLTPQIIQRFYRVFGDQIAVIHSRLTDRERFDSWRSLQRGEKKIAIGARSAVFAPVQDLGLIIVDEEHDTSYKQEDPAPRYHARDVAVMRASLNGAAVVMGSATPSMTALHGAKKGKSTLLSLSERPLGARLPEVEVLDLKQYRSAMRGPIAVPLYQAIDQALERQQQAILLLNRRGFASYLQCEACGHIPECPNCTVSLTYHKAKHQLRCHYCGYSSRSPDRCESCNGKTMQSAGTGTQQLEEEIEHLFEEARILRMDFDTTSGKGAHGRILKQFGRREADILVGTQIVGKGLDFPDVTVVGVINADTELAFPSFRSGERLFQLLSQVAGRSGRSSQEGRVFFQTWQPGHPAVQAARRHDFKAFARQEMAYRKQLLYPPFSRIIRFVFKGKRENRVRQVAERFTGIMVDLLGMQPVLGPSPSTIARMQNYYRWESMVKIDPGNGARAIEGLVERLFDRYEQKKPEGASSVRINVNVDALE